MAEVSCPGELDNLSEFLFNVVLQALASSLESIQAEVFLDESKVVARQFAAVFAVSRGRGIERIVALVINAPEVLAAVDGEVVLGNTIKSVLEELTVSV